MAMPHGTVKSGNSRPINKMGATNKMVSFVSRHSTSKPVSINYLRGMVKNYNSQIDAVDEAGNSVHTLDTKARLTLMRETTYTAIKMFQAAYAVKDMSASAARGFCRMHGVVLPSDSMIPTFRQTGDAVSRISANLGCGDFDNAGMHVVSVEGKPRIPGGYGKDDDEFRELTPDESNFWKNQKRDLTPSPDGDMLRTEYLQRVVRQAGGNGSVRRNGRSVVVPGEYSKATKGVRNTFVDAMTGRTETIPNPKRKKDSVR